MYFIFYYRFLVRIIKHHKKHKNLQDKKITSNYNYNSHNKSRQIIKFNNKHLNPNLNNHQTNLNKNPIKIIKNPL